MDGKEAAIHKTDCVLRSVFLEPGSHTIRLEFRPRSFRLGLFITLAVSTLLILGVVIGAFLDKRKPESVGESGP